MEDRSRRLMMCLLVSLPVIMVGLGLTTARDPRSKISDSSYSPFIPVQTQARAMSMPAAPASVPVYLPRTYPIIAVNRPASQGSWGQYSPDTALPDGTSPWYPPPGNPAMPVNATLPQGLLDLLPPSPADARLALPTDSPAALLASPTTAPAEPTQFKMLPFQEAHWQGLELVPLSAGLKRALKLLSDSQGVIIDDVTFPADMAGFVAGDLITSVGQVPTRTLESFIDAADRVRDRRRAEIQFVRKDKTHSLVLTALELRLGTANGETAPMIKPGSRAPTATRAPAPTVTASAPRANSPSTRGTFSPERLPQFVPVIRGK